MNEVINIILTVINFSLAGINLYFYLKHKFIHSLIAVGVCGTAGIFTLGVIFL